MYFINSYLGLSELTVFVNTNGNVALELRPKPVRSVFAPELHRRSIRARVKQLNAYVSPFTPSPTWRALFCLLLAKRFTLVPHSRSCDCHDGAQERS